MWQRFGEIDALRGVAIVGMVIFHFAFDLDFLGFTSIALYQGVWLLLQRATISLFLLLVGLSLHLVYSRMGEKTATALLTKFGIRAAMLGGIAMAITAATWLVIPSAFIMFGIIHVIALATLVALPFLRFHRLNALLGLLLLLQSIVAPLPSLHTPWLLWLGFTYPGFYSVDYVPLFPWFGLVLIGIFLGKEFYPEGKRKSGVAERMGEMNSGIAKVLRWMGRNSLLVYLIHQPILLGILELVRWMQG